MKSIKFIYFDIGGVLLEHMPGLINLFKILDVPEKEGLELFRKHVNSVDRGVSSWEDFEAIIYEELKPINRLKKSLVETSVSEFRVIQETHDFVNEIKNQVDIGILSNISEDTFNLVLSKNLIPNIEYKAIVKSGEINLLKPEKEIFDHALVKAGVLPEEILFVDDTKINVEVARFFGWNSMLFNTQCPAESVEKIKRYLC